MQTRGALPLLGPCGGCIIKKALKRLYSVTCPEFLCNHMHTWTIQVKRDFTETLKLCKKKYI